MILKWEKITLVMGIALAVLLQLSCTCAKKDRHHRKANHHAKRKDIFHNWLDLHHNVDVIVKTSNLLHADVSGKLHMVFSSSRGGKSARVTAEKNILPLPGAATFPRGESHTFGLHADISHMSKIDRIEFWMEATGIDKDYNLELITVIRKETGTKYIFPISRWLVCGTHYKFAQYDTFLPKNDPYKKRRVRELKKNRKAYAYTIRHDNVSPLTMSLPQDEAFSGGYTIKMGLDNTKSVFSMVDSYIQTDVWTSYKEMFDMFKSKLKEPMYANMNFKQDNWFALSRLQGGNPGIIRLATKIPEKFKVTYKQVKRFINEDSLDEAVKNQKIFIVDYWILKYLQKKRLQQNSEEEIKYVPAPLALFYLNDTDNVLKPIAIQLEQEPSSDNPVFTPSKSNIWLLAKFWFHVADTSYHQAVSHLGLTHYMIESITCVTHRTLAPSHPVYKLLKPHFMFTIAANKLADTLLTGKDGCITDKAFAVGCFGLSYLAGQGIQEFNFSRDGIIPNMFEEQKVTRDILPYYPYRDDITDIYMITREYVSETLKIYYKNNNIMRKDSELRNWRRELSREPESKEDNEDSETELKQVEGIGLKGIPGDDRKGFNHLEELFDTVTTIIITATARHAAINFNQYSWFAFAPNQPAIMNGGVPTEKSKISDEQIFASLPNRQQFATAATLESVLSTRITNLLGDFETQMLYNPKAVKAANCFREQLKKLSKKIGKKNRKRQYPYTFCDPANIPNSIPI